ncbi:MAG TPA: FAD-dependent oxidoreductase, partial [Acidimicrobiia bacterium]|nr:FAD-dependent oxidoreductase [Acidimicrobiia bacterium]
MTIHLPLWTEATPPPPVAEVTLPASADVAVIGAGVTGLAAARRLAAAGQHVVVLEAETLGAGASAVNGGMTTYGLKISAQTAMARYGDRLGRELWQASLDAVDLVERIVTEESIDCGHTRPGSAALGYRERDRSDFTAQAAWMEANLHFPLEVVTGEAMPTVIGSDRFSVALLDRFSAGCDPARYLYGLAAAAARAGATLVEHAGVTA